MSYNLTTCHICRGLMTFQQVQEGVYWLPDMTDVEYVWARYEGFVHCYAHLKCWQRLKAKKRDRIRTFSYAGSEPRRGEQLV